MYQHFKNNKLIQFILKFKKTSILFILLLGIFLIYKLFIVSANNLTPQDAKVVEVEKVTLSNIQQTAQFIGTIKAQRATILTAKSKGILDSLVNSGQQVKKGDLIAQIDNPDVERNYKLSQEAEKIAKLQYERLNQLLSSGVSSKNSVEEKETSWIEYQKRLSDAKIALDEINIYAPFDGIVGIFKVREGSQVQEGDVLVNFYDPSSIIVEFDVPLSTVNAVQDGSPVFINKQQYTLTHIQKMLDEESHMCPAYVKINCERCIIGATVEVNLVVDQKKSVIVIPYEAIFLREGKTFVYTVNHGKAALAAVTLGIREKNLVEITAGLKQGDLVIVRGQMRLYPEAPVTLAATNQ